MGLFDTEQHRTWYRLLRGDKLTRMEPSQFPEDSKCGTCGSDMWRSYHGYTTESNDILYDGECHARLKIANEGLLQQRDRCGR